MDYADQKLKSNLESFYDQIRQIHRRFCLNKTNFLTVYFTTLLS
ncbi:hypothetical protein Nit79A3_1220 [Nitrosomonas sp. Is79A3]